MPNVLVADRAVTACPRTDEVWPQGGYSRSENAAPVVPHQVHGSAHLLQSFDEPGDVLLFRTLEAGRKRCAEAGKVPRLDVRAGQMLAYTIPDAVCVGNAMYQDCWHSSNPSCEAPRRGLPEI